MKLPPTRAAAAICCTHHGALLPPAVIPLHYHEYGGNIKLQKQLQESHGNPSKLMKFTIASLPNGSDKFWCANPSCARHQDMLCRGAEQQFRGAEQRTNRYPSPNASALPPQDPLRPRGHLQPVRNVHIVVALPPLCHYPPDVPHAR